MHDPFAETLQKSREWLREITTELDGVDEAGAWGALRATLHALRDRLPVDDAVKLAAHLPMLIRGAYYEGWRPADVPMRLHVDEFLARVDAEHRDARGDPERLVRAALSVLCRRVPPSVVVHVRNLLPDDLRALWDRSARAHDKEALLEKASAAAADWP